MIIPNTIFKSPLGLTKKSKFKTLAQAIHETIISRQLTPKAKLPPVRNLTYQIKMTPKTITRTYQLLTKKDHLITIIKHGTFIASTQHSLHPTNPTLLTANDHMSQATKITHLLNPKIPNIKQKQIIHNTIHHLTNTIPTKHLLRYPNKQTNLTAHKTITAYLNTKQINAFSINNIITTHNKQSTIIIILQTILHNTHPVMAINMLSYNSFQSTTAIYHTNIINMP